MHWHAQPLSCHKAIVIRGYKKGNYHNQSPYQALMLVLKRRKEYEIQGFLSNNSLTRSDLIKLKRLGIKYRIPFITTRRHGTTVEIKM